LYNTVIIGAGPAGIAAAIYLKRAGVDPVLFEKNENSGGLLQNADWVENYPGFPDGISGMNLINLFRKQLERMNIKVINQEVTDIQYDEKNHFVVSTNKTRMECRSVIAATGTYPQKPGIHGESELTGTRLFYEIKDISRTER